MKVLARALAHVAFGCVCAGAALPFARHLPNSLLPDDGYFYAQIAFNLAQLGRSTFDGIHTTSGYHLPWAFLLAGVSWVVGLFTKAKAVHLFAHLATAFTLIGWTSHHFFRSWLFRASAFVVLTNHFSLTEMTLAAPVLLALLANDRRAIYFAALLPIVRIDLAVVPLVLAAFALSARSERRRGVALAAASLLGVGLQLGLMKVGFGQFFSVAATIKATASPAILAQRLDLNLLRSPFAALLYAATGAFAVIALVTSPRPSTTASVAATLSFLVSHTVLSLLRDWYWVPSTIGMLFLIEGCWRASPSGRLVRFAQLVTASLGALHVAHAVRVEIYYSGDQKNAEAFLTDLQRRPIDTPIFTLDCPGYLGFFSERSIVDGDGLVNDDAFARRMLSGRLAGYLDEQKICWVIGAHADAPRLLAVGGLVVEDDDVERLATFRRVRSNQSDFVIGRLQAPRCRSSPTRHE